MALLSRDMLYEIWTDQSQRSENSTSVVKVMVPRPVPYGLLYETA